MVVGAALNTATGQVIGKTAPRHTSEQFVAFLTDVVASQRPEQEIHVICDNVSSHKTERVRNFLSEHPNVHMHHTPTYTSWLNRVENWFARIQRDVSAQAVCNRCRAHPLWRSARRCVAPTFLDAIRGLGLRWLVGVLHMFP